MTRRHFQFLYNLAGVFPCFMIITAIFGADGSHQSALKYTIFIMGGIILSASIRAMLAPKVRDSEGSEGSN